MTEGRTVRGCCPGARSSDIRAREEQLRSYDRELAELRGRAA